MDVVVVPALPWEPPPVRIMLPDGKVDGVLLAWGRIAAGRWAAGVSYLHRTWHGHALITVWVPSALAHPWEQRRQAGDYRAAPRVALSGPPSSWPRPPPRYPGANAEWISTHQHHVDYRTAPK